MLFKEIILDALDDELTTDEVLRRERAMDKELILLIQAACKADNIPRAIELAKLLHLPTSLDSASKIADFYHLPGFKEKVQRLIADREENEDRLVVARDKRRQWMKPELPPRHLPNANGSSSIKFDPLADNGPPPAIERPGMARVTAPVIETTRYRSMAPTTIHQERGESSATPFSPIDGKRKRDDDADMSSQFDSPVSTPLKSKALYVLLDLTLTLAMARS